MNSTKQPGLIDAPIKPEQTTNEQLWNQQVTETLRVGLGQSGDQSQKFVTWSDMEQAGMIENAADGSGGSGSNGGGYWPTPVTQPPDLTPPPPLKKVAASGGMTAIYITWDNPQLTYSYYCEVHKASENDVGKAVMVGTTNGSIYEHLVGSDTNLYYFWVRVIKQTGGELVIGPWQGTKGVSAAAAEDPEYLLKQLEGRISETELNDTLNSEIDKIAPIETSVGDIKDDINTIDTSIGDIQNDINTIDLDIGSLETGLNTEVTERQASDQSLHTRIESNVSRLDDNAAAIVTESTTRVTEDEALASEITTLKSEVDGNTAAIQTESTTRATEDEAIASQITTLNANVGDNSAALQSEIETRAGEDEAIGKRVDSIAVNVGDNAAAIQTESEARATEDEAIASEITTLRSDVDGNEAAIQSESKTRSDEDEAQASLITTLQTDVGGNTAAIQTESEARSTEDTALAKTIDSMAVSVGENAAAIQTESEARATEDEAIATQITTLVSEVGTNTAAIQTESEARATEDEAIAGQITTLQSTVGDNTAAIKTESETRASADEAVASQIETIQTDLGGVQGSVETNASAIAEVEGDVTSITTEYSVKLDSDGYVGGFGLINDSETITALWRVDVFAVGAPGSDSLTFAIDTKEDRVVMSGAYIEDASITDAQIGDLTVEKLTGGTADWVNANIENGSIDNAKIGNYIQSDPYVSGSQGWHISKQGIAEFSNILCRGRIESSLVIGSILEGALIIQDEAEFAVPTDADKGAGTTRYLSNVPDYVQVTSKINTNDVEPLTPVRLAIYSANYTASGKTDLDNSVAGYYNELNRYLKYSVVPKIIIKLRTFGNGNEGHRDKSAYVRHTSQDDQNGLELTIYFYAVNETGSRVKLKELVWWVSLPDNYNNVVDANFQHGTYSGDVWTPTLTFNLGPYTYGSDEYAGLDVDVYARAWRYYWYDNREYTEGIQYVDSITISDNIADYL